MSAPRAAGFLSALALLVLLTGGRADALASAPNATVQLSPPSAAVFAGTAVTLTAHVNVDPGSGTFGNAPDGTVIAFSGTNAAGATASYEGPSSCTTSGGTGSCTVTVSSPSAGITTIHASTSVTVGGTQLTRATADGLAGDGPDAVVTWTPLPGSGSPSPALAIVLNPKGQTVSAGGSANFAITVTNTGNTPLTDVRVVDPLAPACNRTRSSIPDLSTLAAGANVTYKCTRPHVVNTFVDVASAVATSPNRTDVSASAAAQVRVQVYRPKPHSVGTELVRLHIAKKLKGGSVALRGTARFTVTVTNTGSVRLHGVEVTDRMSPNCERRFGSIAAAESMRYTCSRPDVLATYTDVANVVGVSPRGIRVSAQVRTKVKVKSGLLPP